MKYLVTGGAGFIGSNIVEELVKKNEDVVVVDNLVTGRYDNIKKFEYDVRFVKCDIRNLKKLKILIKDCDYVLHQAALGSVLRSIRNPEMTVDTNVIGTLNVLLASKDANIKKVVFASSSSVYGGVPKICKKESMTPKPLSPYAASKLSGENICSSFRESYELEIICLRYFNVYGPRQDPSSKYAAVIPKFLCQVSNDKQPTIYGDGTQTRDFTFVKDVVRANLVATKSNVKWGVFNVAGGKRTSVNNLAEKIIKLRGSGVKPVHLPERKGDVKHAYADIGKAQELLKFKPKYSLDKGLKITIKSFKEK